MTNEQPDQTGTKEEYPHYEIKAEDMPPPFREMWLMLLAAFHRLGTKSMRMTAGERTIDDGRRFHLLWRPTKGGGWRVTLNEIEPEPAPTSNQEETAS